MFSCGSSAAFLWIVPRSFVPAGEGDAVLAGGSPRNARIGTVWPFGARNGVSGPMWTSPIWEKYSGGNDGRNIENAAGSFILLLILS